MLDFIKGAAIIAGASLNFFIPVASTHAESLPSVPGSPSYTVYIDNGFTEGKATATFWRQQLSDGNTYLLARYTPTTGRYLPCLYDYIQVNGIESGGPNRFYTDLPLGDNNNPNRPDFCNKAIVAPVTLIVSPDSVYLPTLKWDINKTFVIRFGKGSDKRQTVASLIIPDVNSPNGSGATAFDYSDTWWNPAESGWGMQITHHVGTGGNIVGAFYLYDASGNPEWFYISGGTWTLNTFSATVYRVTGSPGSIAGLVTFNANLTKATPVGSSTFLFNSQNSLTLSYTINGVSGTKQLSRLPF